MFGEVSISSQLQRKEFIYMAENEKAIIFYPNYRGSSMSEGNDEFGGGDVNDIINLYPIISKYKYCDNTKISLYGYDVYRKSFAFSIHGYCLFTNKNIVFISKKSGLVVV